MHPLLRHQLRRSSTSSITSAPAAVSIPDFLRVPSWSVASLLPPSPTSSTSSTSPSSPSTSPPLTSTSTPSTLTTPTITPQTLHHLLRLSALPPPPTPSATASLLSSLHAHLHFIQSMQCVDTTGVSALSRVEDEVVRPQITWEDATKTPVRMQRFERGMRGQGRVGWSPMGLAQKVVGGFYVVDEKVTEELVVEVAEGEGEAQGEAPVEGKVEKA
ncbi:hypothetical protein BZA05DRAFT_225752 [Tricharina praecox]|uniref:uncharacterized protein n=1 Tax=Tricharina praecox TaxID=43433 RepID=UPI002220A42C|nr:uncharacterized protein BZA05DRAFT_225752 [Tricharina praecox]KAI5856068.1 hypothetical protein BZA05DRAFT_225752 [Tricharina praecox]